MSYHPDPAERQIALAATTLETIQAQLHDRKRRIIRADGTIEYIDSRLTNAEISRRIGATTTDTVNLRHLGLPLVVMIVDDRGYETEERHEDGVLHLIPIKPLKPLNAIATALYLANAHPDVEHWIVGDVFIVPDSDFAGPDGF